MRERHGDQGREHRLGRKRHRPRCRKLHSEDDRIAGFDNDGTLWAEQPLYFQALYALDVLRETAAADPSILASDVLLAAAEGDLEGMMANGVDGLVEVFNVSHAGITVEDFIRHIGQRPILSGGNSDGDFAMAKWTKLGEDHDSAFSSVTMPRLANLPITATATPASSTAASTRLRGAAGWSR